MDYTNLNKILYDFGDRTVAAVQKSIDEKGINATRVLRQSIDYKVYTLENETQFKLGWISDANDYAYFADKGRKAGRRPPTEPIEKWITAKGIDLRPKGGLKRGQKYDSLKARKQMAFMIARNIGLKGTKATNFWSDVVNDSLFDTLKADMRAAFKKDILIELKKD